MSRLSQPNVNIAFILLFSFPLLPTHRQRRISELIWLDRGRILRLGAYNNSCPEQRQLGVDLGSLARGLNTTGP
jgi:hypothetical protein